MDRYCVSIRAWKVFAMQAVLELGEVAKRREKGKYLGHVKPGERGPSWPDMSLFSCPTSSYCTKPVTCAAYLRRMVGWLLKKVRRVNRFVIEGRLAKRKE